MKVKDYRGVHWDRVQDKSKVKKNWENACSLIKMALCAFLLEMAVSHYLLAAAKFEPITEHWASQLLLYVGLMSLGLALHNFVKLMFHLLEEDEPK